MVIVNSILQHPYSYSNICLKLGHLMNASPIFSLLLYIWFLRKIAGSSAAIVIAAIGFIPACKT